VRSSKQRTAKQDEWLKRVADIRSLVSCQPGQIHHCAGTTARHNRIDIGHWWILALTKPEHDRLHRNELNIEHGFRTRKEFEKVFFTRTVHVAQDKGWDVPPDDVLAAIEDYHR